jgi:hypothetical protein
MMMMMMKYKTFNDEKRSMTNHFWNHKFMPIIL